MVQIPSLFPYGVQPLLMYLLHWMIIRKLPLLSAFHQITDLPTGVAQLVAWCKPTTVIMMR